MKKPVFKQAPSGELYTTESAMQCSCVRWFRTVYKPLALFLFSIPNGGKLGGRLNKNGSPTQAGIMVGEGLTAGVADLFLAIPKCGLHGLFIEMKTPVGVWSKEQREFAARQIGQGYGYALCRSQIEFEDTVNKYLTNAYCQTQIGEIEKKRGRKIGTPIVKTVSGR